MAKRETLDLQSKNSGQTGTTGWRADKASRGQQNPSGERAGQKWEEKAEVLLRLMAQDGHFISGQAPGAGVSSSMWGLPCFVRILGRAWTHMGQGIALGQDQG